MLKKVTLTAAQLLALNATPVEVIEAPGSGTAIVIDKVIAEKSAGTAFADIAAGDDIGLKYTDGSGASHATIECTGFMDQTAKKTQVKFGSGVLLAINAPIVAHMATGEITTGTCTLKLSVYYHVIKL